MEGEGKSETVTEIPLIIPSDVFQIILDRREIPEIISHLLKGEVYDYKNQAWIKKGKPLMNDEGIRTIVTILSNYCTIDKIAAKLENERVAEMARSIRLDLINLLTLNYKKFGIQKGNLSLIVDLIDHTVYANLTGGREATILDFMKPVYKRVETFKPEEKKKWYSFIPFLGSE